MQRFAIIDGMKALSSLCLSILLLLTFPLSVAAEDTPDREGTFGGFEVALAVSNFDAPTEEENADVGALAGFHAGYRWDFGLGLSGGISGALFDFEVELPGVTMDADVTFDMLDASAWYFLDLGDQVQARLRAGAGYAEGRFSTMAGGQTEKGFGYVLSGGVAWAPRAHTLVFVEAYLRDYGLSLEAEGMESNLRASGLSIGVGWRP